MESNKKKTILLIVFKVNQDKNYSVAIAESIINSSLAIELGVDVEIVLEVFEHSYVYCNEAVKALWLKYSPYLVIQLGDYEGKTIDLELCAHSYYYSYPDIHGTCPAYLTCPFDERGYTLYTAFEVLPIVQKDYPREVQLSDKAGLHVFEYAYYMSLSHDPGKAIAIHIPPPVDYETPVIEAIIIRDIIKELFGQCLTTPEWIWGPSIEDTSDYSTYEEEELED